MRTVLLEQPYQLKHIETEPPVRKPGEALARVKRIGVCGTDLHAFRGRQPYFTYPRVLGHELAVEVVEVDAGDGGIAAGDLCVVVPYLSCGTCIACRAGKTNCCTRMKVLGVHVDGGMTEMISLPASNLIPAAGLSLEQVALVENQSIGAHAVRRAAPLPGETALVVGAGPIGLGVIQAAVARGARVIVADVSPDRLDFCSRHLGVDAAIDARGDTLAQLDRMTSGELAPVVFDATGNPGSMEKSLDFAAS
ncbi:MAG TPA: alcohol dehydrogenase catalytic domain-containing protein, partial [Planctomycetaceae bacterium]